MTSNLTAIQKLLDEIFVFKDGFFVIKAPNRPRHKKIHKFAMSNSKLKLCLKD